MSEFAWQFSRAITRQPAASIVNGLRAEDSGDPDLGQMLQDHSQYVATLKEAGAKVTELAAVDAYPDSVFVEDVALCLPEVAILMRPGAATRRGEVTEMTATLQQLFEQVSTINGPGFIEGGDILTTPKEILVGRSNRTDAAGISELRNLVAEFGYLVREVNTPAGVLHFKTDCSLTRFRNHSVNKTTRSLRVFQRLPG